MYKPIEIEKEVLKFWKAKKIFDKLRKKNKNKKPWSFIDGPITANNPMGVHHAWGRTYKDLYQRFKAMQGFDQRFQNGFDCQGLWLEVETEKELGFNSKKDIEKYGLANFSKACKARVNNFSKIQTEQSIKLGQWMDWENSYYTMSDTNIEYIWYFLKKCHEKGWLYKGTKVLPWCTRCGTSSSQHEMSDEGYAELTHPAIYVKAKIKNRENEFLLLWTTTEWTLSSNIALAVNPELNYSKVKVGEEILYIAKPLLKKLKGNHIVLDTVQGKDLIGLEYESLYPDLPVQKGIKHNIISWKDVSETEGTGIVHIAPTCGEEDYEVAKKEKLPIIKPALDEAGNFNKGFGWLSGKNVKRIKPEIIKDLEKRNLLYKQEQYKHRYPVCWRCKNELVFRMDSEWFISCDKIRPLMKKAAIKVEWSPKHIGKLMQDWLDNMGDWNISRKRYWGLPLMFFECGCGNLKVIGSLKELKEKAVDKKKVEKLPELHRPWIDEIKIKCPKCGKEVSRIKEIGDCWLDAGIVPFSTLHYFDDKKYWRKWFPAELVIEMRAQTRLWFYSLLFMGITLENKAPYERVFAYEEVRDEKNQPMHKSLGNVIWFDEAVEKMGADVMRWMYCSQNPMFPLLFGYTPAKEVEQYLKVIWNIGNYVKLYCIKPNKKEKNLDLASKWIVSRRESLKEDVTNYLENLQPRLAMKQIRNYLLEDLSRWYGQIIRENLDADKTIQGVLYNSFLDGLKILAPVLPFMTEKLYQGISKNKESIFLEDWPKANKKLIDKKLEENMQLAKDVIQEILAQREKAQIGVRWPLSSAAVAVDNPAAVKSLSEIIKTQTNVKDLKIKKGKFSVKLETKLNLELEKEGFARELTRRIQALRKKTGLKKSDSIELSIYSSYDLNELKKEIKTSYDWNKFKKRTKISYDWNEFKRGIKISYDLSKFKKEIQSKVGAKILVFEKKKLKEFSREKIKDKEFEISFRKI